MKIKVLLISILFSIQVLEVFPHEGMWIPSLLKIIDVGIPLNLNFLAKVTGASKNGIKFFISKSSKKFNVFDSQQNITEEE